MGWSSKAFKSNALPSPPPQQYSGAMWQLSNCVCSLFWHFSLFYNSLAVWCYFQFRRKKSLNACKICDQLLGFHWDNNLFYWMEVEFMRTTLNAVMIFYILLRKIIEKHRSGVTHTCVFFSILTCNRHQHQGLEREWMHKQHPVKSLQLSNSKHIPWHHFFSFFLFWPTCSWLHKFI